MVVAVRPAAPSSVAPSLEAEFAAPVGRKVRMVTVFTAVLLAFVVLAGIGFSFVRPLPGVIPALPLGAALVAAAGTILVAWLAQVCGYRLTRDELLVVRRNRHTRFPLAGLTEAIVVPDAMAWALKIAGNDGLVAITGSYWSKRLGRFRALVTDRQRTVVLRWTDRCLVVSPDRPEEFVREVHRRIGRPG